MLPRRLARKAPGPISTGDRCPPADAMPGPGSPLERNPLSPKGWRKRESDGVGLGIVAKLDCTVTSVRSSSKPIIGPAMAPISIGYSQRGGWPSGVKLSAAEHAGDFPVTDFLSCCYLCRKRLHGRDVYMYRGEKAFCSIECRYQQIVSDECMEKYGSEYMRRTEVPSSPCSAAGGSGGGRLFFTGIVAV
ncbi:hypothetical protein HPP92_011065 [Vanilla planifolia]|uniref:FLZ-type domain-containing protein n=1 Tax=Vanilla planifolia TaxID=51239 RepID=A0A835R6D9_VANPL|nr:hypothetical protein HPP92_011065 [Vanilla planifolia]